MIKFEKEVCDYLCLPSIPAKEWDGKTFFEKGVAVIETKDSGLCYAACVCRVYDNGNMCPVILRVFSLEPFVEIKKVFVVPNYMVGVDDVASMDLDESSKKAAEQLLTEASELSEDDDYKNKTNTPQIEDLPEWIFPEITNKDEAQAWLRRYNKRNKIKASKVPSSPETIKLRLYSIFVEQMTNK